MVQHRHALILSTSEVIKSPYVSNIWQGANSKYFTHQTKICSVCAKTHWGLLCSCNARNSPSLYGSRQLHSVCSTLKFTCLNSICLRVSIFLFESELKSHRASLFHSDTLLNLELSRATVLILFPLSWSWEGTIDMENHHSPLQRQETTLLFPSARQRIYCCLCPLWVIWVLPLYNTSYSYSTTNSSEEKVPRFTPSIPLWLFLVLCKQRFWIQNTGSCNKLSSIRSTSNITIVKCCLHMNVRNNTEQSCSYS